MSNTKISKLQIFLNGLIKENPVLVLVLGTWPSPPPWWPPLVRASPLPWF